MEIELHYGEGLTSLQIPQANVGRILRPWQDDQTQDNAETIRNALKNKRAENFKDQVAGKRLCVLTEDGTRGGPGGDVFGQCFDLMKHSSAVLFLICTGTHSPQTAENAAIRRQILDAAGRAGIGDFSVHIHDCRHDEFIDAGRTSHGTDILVNAQAHEADAFLVISDVKVHYFAGYSNAVKNFVPGICAFKTAEQNHSLALDTRSTFGCHPWQADGRRRDNPLARDQLEGMRLIVKHRPVYTLSTISSAGSVNWARFGEIESVSREAFATVDQRNTHTVEAAGRLVVSPGGLPNDISLYIAQRALELTKNAVLDGGEILFLAACPNGIGEDQTIENFYNRLTAPVDDILQSVQAQYKLYSHKPYKFAQLIKRLRRIWIHSEIPDNLLEAAHLYPTDQPQAVVDGWLAEDPAARITIVDGANKIALYAAR